MSRRVRWTIAVALALFVPLLSYGTFVEPRLILDVEREDVALPHLGRAWTGTEIALVSDWQIGMWFANTGMMERATERILEEDPDIALLGGDFIYGDGPPGPKVERFMGIIGPLIASGIPTYAVLGNHDYDAEGAGLMTVALEDAGVPVLQNDVVALRPPSGAPPLYVVGLGPHRFGLDAADAALAQVPDDSARIVLMHNPLTFLDLPAHSAPLALAGHTHCGQIALPLTEHWSWMDVTAREKVVADDWEEEGYGAEGNRLFVTCGLGFSVVPVRVSAPPQVVFLELRPGAPDSPPEGLS